ncbi:MAG: WecB/TagA/CpsF family glycosyltransferase [Geobacter sp.]|nr:WecB/TagA/CpsF family glycosyltransferase [Geobacter sp.]
MKPVETEDILDYAVYADDREACIMNISDWVASGDHCRWLACLNPHSFVSAQDDPQFAEALHDADWLIPDGSGIVLAAKILGRRIRGRITGSDIFWGLQETLNRSGGCSVFFLGSTAKTLSMIRTKMSQDFPHIEIAGTYSPPYKTEFNEEDNGLMVEAINRVKPDVLWVGMTAPKQEKWICQNKALLNVKFIGAIGAVFDFYSGKVKRSHPLFQELGLEWLPRLMREPRRLWRRNLISAPRFLVNLLLMRARSLGTKQKY